jgi:prepilin-type N-terminal cleavage/methylation domain-containing protein
VRRHARGFSMVETMVAIALLGVIVVTVVSAFSTVSVATRRHGVATDLDRLTRSEAETIKSQLYAAKPRAYANLAAPGYAFAVQILYYNPVNQTFSAANNDQGLQQILLTVTAKAGGSETLRFFKVQP